MKTYIIKPRTKEYRISVDNVTHHDGSVSRVVFCNNKLVRFPGLSDFPKTIVSALSRELDNQ